MNNRTQREKQNKAVHKIMAALIGVLALAVFLGYWVASRGSGARTGYFAGAAGVLLVVLTAYVVRAVDGIVREVTQYKKEQQEFSTAKEALDQKAWGMEKTNDAIKRLYKDIQKEKERANQASKAKSDFLGNMSHELRTPLNAIIGYSEALADELFGPLNERQKEYADIVVQSGRHLLSLINDVLDIAKIEAGKMDLDLSMFDVNKVVDQSVSLIKERTLKHNIEIRKNVEGGLGMIRADERKVKQILYNLLSNATKFTPEGGTVEIEIQKTSEGGLLVAVRDTGIGIEEKDRDKVFEEFKQIDSSLTRQHKGTGLGMPLTKKFVELHEGRIWFESEGKDKGTQFYFTLPLKGLAGERG